MAAGRVHGFNDYHNHPPDFILAWKDNTNTPSQYSLRSFQMNHNDDEIEQFKLKRKIFQDNLIEIGLILEPVIPDTSRNINFIKIYTKIIHHHDNPGHLPIHSHHYTSINHKNNEVQDEDDELDVLRTYAEILKIRMPMKKIPDQPVDAILTGTYSRDKEYLYDMDETKVFKSTLRSRIIEFILSRTRYSNNPEDIHDFGIERLLKEDVYTGAYPLHEADTRENLKNDWASLRCILKHQPLDEIKDYFGVKVGLYFAWLGFYTRMLFPAAIVGFICFLYGCITLHYDDISNEICTSNITHMCPKCNKNCDYWDLKDECLYASLTYLNDNYATVFFAFFMSIWSAIFMEYWKRYSAEIDYRWDLTSFDVCQEQPRPEYITSAHLKHNHLTKINKITNLDEPYVPFWTSKMPSIIISVASVLFLITLPIIAVVGVIIYRLSVTVALTASSNSDDDNTLSNTLVTTSASIVNLIFIIVFNKFYELIAYKLTCMEMPRTQSVFDYSLTIKMYLVQFVNFYSSIIYIAFFKGKFAGVPGNYNTLFGYRQEECGPIGCMTELCIQLAIIMIGKQLVGAFQEMALPPLLRWWKRKLSKVDGLPEQQPIWIQDYFLEDWGPQSLFPEYLEMVLQYGFVTLFVAAFPLAPLFALLNNIIEIRLDALKFLKEFKRPVAQRVKNIGSWYGILISVSNLAILANALIIALTSSAIPKIVYYYDFGTLDGFLNYSLSYFNTSDLKFMKETLYSKNSNTKNVSFCRYVSYHLAQEKLKHHVHNYLTEFQMEREIFYWKVWLGRLIFIILFQNIVTGCVVMLKWIIPDISKDLSEKIRRENYWTMEAIILHESTQGGWNRLSKRRKIIEQQQYQNNTTRNNIRIPYQNAPNILNIPVEDTV